MIKRKLKDAVAGRIMLALSCAFIGLFSLVVIGLFLRARPVLLIKPLKEILFSFAWHPANGEFGLAGFITGTLWVTAIAMVISIPLSILCAIYLSEYLNKKTREYIKPLIDLLSGISPVIYGVWGVIVIVPLVRDCLMPFIGRTFPFFPFLSDNYTGYFQLSG